MIRVPAKWMIVLPSFLCRRGAVAIALFLGAIACSSAAVPVPAGGSGPLLRDFESPSESARPRLWWHWLGGDIRQAGVRKDMEWMHRIGIGGVDVIDVSLFTPNVVASPLDYMSPGWKSAFRLAARLATRDRLELSIDSSPGWSETGGPWVKPSQAMKKLVWSTTVIQGGRPFHGILREPPANTGPFQDAPMSAGILGPEKYAALKFYRDSEVIAYRAPVLDPVPRSATSSSGPVGGHALSSLDDGTLNDGISLPAKHGGAWLDMRYARPVRVQAVTLAAGTNGAFAMAATVYARAARRTWKPVAHLSTLVGELGDRFPEETLSFPPVTTREIRLLLRVAPPPQLLLDSATNNAVGAVPLSAQLAALAHPSKSEPAFILHELVLHSVAAINQFEAKAYYRIVPDYYSIASTAPVAPGSVVNSRGVVDLTSRMKPDGELDWTPPPGHWVVLRMGYSLEGTANHPAPLAWTGLEVDKLSRADVHAYMLHYLDLYRAITGSFGRNSLTAFTADSTEVGMQNWTPRMIADFKRLRGYDPTPWLPTLTGVVVDSAAASDRFLWDFRRTINELLARNDYREVQRVAHAQGLVTYGEALENRRPTFGDDMEMRQYTDVPMGAMWMYPSGGRPYPTYVADVRGAASVAHIYGQNLVGAETFDSVDQPWAYSPRELKPVVDSDFLLGVNRVEIHESSEQPNDRPPGLSLAFFGEMFDRLDTWAGEAKPWISYISRCDDLLQQGHYVADIAYFYGQEAPITSLFGDKRIEVPAGYGFDFVNADVLKHELGVDGHRLVTRTGMRYRLLYLGGSSRWMSLGVLRRIDALVREGATVVGHRPIGSPSLRDNPEQFQVLASALFGPAGSTAVRHVGGGRVFPAGSLPQAIAALGIQPDFEYTDDNPGTRVLAIHRKLSGGDVYFVSNRRDRPVNLMASFRVSGQAPELWNAIDGSVQPVSYRIARERTVVPLRLAPYGSIFVVFSGPKAPMSMRVSAPPASEFEALHGPWQVSFQDGRGAPAATMLPHLTSWTRSKLPGIKYFSGTATYRRTFQLSPSDDRGHIVLDLGRVRELAKVSVNGKAIGILWTPPFRLDVTQYVHPGENTLSIAVTNLWVNRLIGDQQPGVKRKYTFTTIPTYEPDAPLRVSGLLGPVRLEHIATAGDR